MTNKKLLISLTLALLSSQVFAGSTSSNFQSTAILNSSCTISMTDINFGTLTPASTGSLKVNGTLTSTCSNNVSYKLYMNSGSGTVRNRTMVGKTAGNQDVLSYNLYMDSSYSSFWGDNLTAGSSFNSVGIGSVKNITIYGKVDLNQYVQPDNYADTLIVFLDY